MDLYDDARPDAPCAVCGAQADTRCDWGYLPAHGGACARPLCWGCAVETMDDAGGADIWCPHHTQDAVRRFGVMVRT
jgi:hypothetical protein